MQSISVLEAGNATLAQLVEQRIRNAQVEGSNPLSGSLAALDLWIPGGFCLWSGSEVKKMKYLEKLQKLLGFALEKLQSREEQGIYNEKAPHKCEGLSAVRMGLEPTTSGVTGPHSNQLNYRTKLFICVGCFSQTRCKVTHIF